jgi:arylformamidase
MALNDLPPQPPIFPAEAEAYVQRAMELSRDALTRCGVVTDIAYGDDVHQRLDVYRPAQRNGTPCPVLVFAHGGAWTNGYKEWMGLLAPVVTALPAILVSISYRLAPAHRYPDPFDDAVAALAWVHRQIAEHGGDPDRVFAGGHSSGGTLYALAALRPDALERAGLPRDAIKGCMPLSSRFDLVLDDPAPGSTEERHKSMIFAPGTDMAAYSPLHTVAGAQTPFLIAHGSADMPALCAQAAALRDALRAQGAHVEHLVLDDHDHFDTALNVGDADNPWTRAMSTWLRTGPGRSRCTSTVPVIHGL